MEVKLAIEQRRNRRAIGPKPVELDKIAALVEAMRLAPSCNNNQPWRVVVCREPESITKARSALSKGNVWATRAPVIFVVTAKLEDDCHGLSDRRDYYFFGCGLAVGQMGLLATEMGLVAHAIAGYDPLVLKRELGIPDNYVAITMVIVGYLDNETSLMSEKQKATELVRPERKPIAENFFEGGWGVPLKE